MRISHKRPSPATVISMIALFVALSGVAIASVPNNSVTSAKVRNNSLKSVDIRNGQVKTADVANNNLTGTDINESTLVGVSPAGAAGGDLTGTYPNPLVGPDAISSAEVAADSLGAGDLGPDSVGTSEVAANSLGAGDLAPNSVDSSEIAAGAVGANELGDQIHEHTATGNAVDTTALDGDWDETSLITATCGVGEELIGVASTWTSGGDELATQQLNPDFTNESVGGIGISDDGGTATFQVTAVCSF